MLGNEQALSGDRGQSTAVEVSKPLSGRVISIDALRGFDMFWIMGGGRLFAALDEKYHNPTTAWIKTQLSHVDWQGFRFEDLIMPLFLFIVGVAMPFSFAKRLSDGHGKLRLYLHIIKRTLILFVLGMIAQGNLLDYDLSKLHIYCNTLQAIAAGYLISSLIILNAKLSRQVVITAGLLLLFWGLMMLVPVPGHGAGQLTKEGNLAIYIDKLILGGFQDGTTYTWILSSITFACTVMLGVFGGYILRAKTSGVKKVALLVLVGVGSVGLGLAWDRWFPIIKHLWTSSFVLLAGGLSYLLLAGFYLVIDVLRLRKLAFGLVVIGSNAIAAYMAISLFDFRRIGDIFVGSLAKYVGDWNAFMHAVAGLVVIWLILFWMYRKRTFVKV
jgi:predicted acyltransferase